MLTSSPFKYVISRHEPHAGHNSGASLASVDLTNRKSQSPSESNPTAMEMPQISEPTAAPELIGHESAVSARGGGGEIEGEPSSAHGEHSGAHPLQVLRHKQFWTLFMVGLANLYAINMYSNTWKVKTLCSPGLHNLVSLLMRIFK